MKINRNQRYGRNLLAFLLAGGFVISGCTVSISANVPNAMGARTDQVNRDSDAFRDGWNLGVSLGSLRSGAGALDSALSFPIFALTSALTGVTGQNTMPTSCDDPQIRDLIRRHGGSLSPEELRDFEAGCRAGRDSTR
jgi:hypothetical protein